MKKIYISGGHGKNGEKHDNGAVASNGTTERSVIVGVGTKMMQLIDDDRVVFDNFINSVNHQSRVLKVNQDCIANNLNHKDSLYIELHADWKGASEGTCAYYYRGYDEAKKLAESFSSILARDTGRKFKWTKGDNESRFGSLYTIYHTIPTAILLEIGSLRSNGNENDGLELIGSEDGQWKIARSLVNTLSSKFDIKIKKEEVQENILNLNMEEINKEMLDLYKEYIGVSQDLRDIFSKFGKLTKKITNLTEKNS